MIYNTENSMSFIKRAQLSKIQPIIDERSPGNNWSKNSLNIKGRSRFVIFFGTIVHFHSWLSKNSQFYLGKVSFAPDKTERTEPNETITMQPSHQQFKQPLCGCSLCHCCFALWCGFIIVDDVAVYLDKKSSCISPFYCLFCCFIVSFKNTSLILCFSDYQW